MYPCIKIPLLTLSETFMNAYFLCFDFFFFTPDYILGFIFDRSLSKFKHSLINTKFVFIFIFWLCPSLYIFITIGFEYLLNFLSKLSAEVLHFELLPIDPIICNRLNFLKLCFIGIAFLSQKPSVVPQYI